MRSISRLSRSGRLYTAADDPGTTDPIAADQRGVARPSARPDIGAFQDRGFTISVLSGNGQSTALGQAFATDLTVAVSSPYGDPVAGGLVTFTPPSGAASAELGAPPAAGADPVPIAAGGQAQVVATADGIAGSYSVSASAAGAAAAGFSLTNLYPTTFSGLAAPTIVYGTSTATLGGTVLAGSTAPPGSVAITLAGVTEQAAINADGSFSATFVTAGLGVAGSPYTISYAYAAQPGYLAAGDTGHTLAVTPATPTMTVTDAGGLATGNPFPATATVAGVNGVAAASLEGVAPSLTYYAGTAAAGTPLPGAPSAVGTYTVLAAFPGSADYSVASTTATFSITQTTIVGVSVGWGAYGIASLVVPATAGGLLLPAGRSTDLPWLGIDSIAVTLGTAAPLAAADVSVVGVVGGSYGPVTVSGSGTSYTIDLATAINAADRVELTIGNVSIAAFGGELAVLPGDLDDEGTVSAADVTAEQDQILGVIAPTLFGDTTGDVAAETTPTVQDLMAVRGQEGTTLPPGD